MKRTAITLALAALALAGCSAQAPTATSPASPSEQPVATEATITEAPMPGFTEPAAFGSTVTFPGGVTVSVDKKSFGPAPENVGVEGTGEQAVFTIKMTNGSHERIDATRTSWPRVTYGSGAEPATPIKNADITTMLPKDTKADTFARFIPDSGASKVRVEVADPSGGESAIFEGSAK